MIVSQCTWCSTQQPYDADRGVVDRLYYLQYPTTDGPVTYDFCSPVCVYEFVADQFGISEDTDEENQPEPAANARYSETAMKLSKLTKEALTKTPQEEKIDYRPEGIPAADIGSLSVKEMDAITGVTRK